MDILISTSMRIAFFLTYPFPSLLSSLKDMNSANPPTAWEPSQLLTASEKRIYSSAYILK